MEALGGSPDEWGGDAASGDGAGSGEGRSLSRRVGPMGRRALEEGAEPASRALGAARCSGGGGRWLRMGRRTLS